MYWMVCSVYYLGCVVLDINALCAEWRIPERDYFQILLLGILSEMDRWNALFIFRYRCCIITTFDVLLNKYLLNLRPSLLVVLRALVHLIYQVIVTTSFFFLDSNNSYLISFFLDKYSLLIFDVVAPLSTKRF